MSVHFFPPTRRSEAIRPILQRALERQGFSRKLERRITPAVWSQAVGAELASRMQPTRLVAGVLHVLVQDHVWRDQLDAARGTVIARINQQLGAPLVRELHFGLAHAGALDAACAAKARPALVRAPLAPLGVLGSSGPHLEPSLRDALLRVAGAASRRALRT